LKNKDNGKTKPVYEIRIQVFEDSSYNLSFNREGVVLESVRAILRQIIDKITEEITFHKWTKKTQDGVQIVRPDQLPKGLELKQ
jgi:hypothetical protein